MAQKFYKWLDVNISLYSKVRVLTDLMIAVRLQIKLNKHIAFQGLSVQRSRIAYYRLLHSQKRGETEKKKNLGFMKQK